MQRRRVLEMLGSFVLGGGLVALVYELGGRAPAVTTEPVADATEEHGNLSALRAVVDVGFIDRDELPGVLPFREQGVVLRPQE